MLDLFIVPFLGDLEFRFRLVWYGGHGLQSRSIFFAWKASWGKLLTLDQLKRRGWNIPNRCHLWKREEKTTFRLFLFCSKARMLQNSVYSLFGVQWVLHSSIKRNLLYWHGSYVGKKRKYAGLIPYTCRGLFGRKGIERLLMTLSSLIKQLNLFLCILLWTVLGCIQRTIFCPCWVL